MMTKEQHMQYSKAIRELQEKAGENLSINAKKLLKILFVKSGGNLDALLKMLVETQKMFIGTSVQKVRTGYLLARDLGRKFRNGT